MNFKYSHEKNTKLLQERKIGFEEIIQEINYGNLVDITHHPNMENYPNQRIMYVRVLETIYVVPYVTEEDGSIFLKTLYPSRKATKRYL